MRIAAFQMQAVPGDVAANLAKLENAARKAAGQGASLLVAPELAICGYGAGAEMARLAQTPNGENWKHLAGVSSDLGISILTGFAERIGDDVYNSAMFIDGDKPPVVYRKSHLYGPYERDLFKPERPTACIFAHGGLKIGVLVCYDVEFPENVRRLAMAGAQTVLVPTALPASDHAEFIARKMIPVRAYENQVFVAYVNHCMSDALFAYAGLSGIAAPDGNMLAAAGPDAEELLIADLEPDMYQQARDENPYLTDLRLG